MSKAISDETAIWRYMDLPKFISMLSTKTLWFAKAASFEDGYECFCEVARREMPLNDPLAKCITRTVSGREPELISLTRMVVDLSREAAAHFDRAPEHIYVNSWCLADESMAMWQIYGSDGCGIAVKSSIDQYRRSAMVGVAEQQYTLDCVEYDLDSGSNSKIDVRPGSTPVAAGLWRELLKIAFHKRTCFEYENEWRAALYQDERDIPGCNIDVDLDSLVSEVYIGPRASQLVFDVVCAVMDRFELKKPLKQSDLLQKPQRIAPFAAE
jgi:hypothetical protein